jgi:transcriptional antiterminator RfaH
MQTATSDLSTNHARWYLIQCKRREEFRALEHLGRQQFSCYLPTLAVEKRRNGRKLDAREPLFPGYLFIKLDDVSDNWHPIRSTRGVIQIVRFSEHPVPVQDEIVETIRQRLAGNPPRVPYLQPGERVVITEGCFAELEAIFVANDGDERVMLLMNIFNREQTLSFPALNVRKSRDPEAVWPSRLSIRSTWRVHRDERLSVPRGRGHEGPIGD